MGTPVVDSFYPVAFPDERSFWRWNERVVEFATIVRDLFVDRSELRAVIFAPHWPDPRAPIRAYVSPGACRLAVRMSEGALIDRSTVIRAAELPPGLTMLLGEDVDEEEYEERHPWRDWHGSSVS